MKIQNALNLEEVELLAELLERATGSGQLSLASGMDDDPTIEVIVGTEHAHPVVSQDDDTMTPSVMLCLSLEVTALLDGAGLHQMIRAESAPAGLN